MLTTLEDAGHGVQLGATGLFARILLQEMCKPGVGVDRVLRNVRDQVVSIAKEFNHQQMPALYDQAISEFYFWPPWQSANAGPAPAPA